MNSPVILSLPFSILSRGPFEFDITKQPDHGVLDQAGNDVTCTPADGYVGVDTYQWTVKDLSNNKTRTVVNRRLLIAIDGPAGAGKSATAR